MTNKVLFISHEASRTGAPIILLNLLQWLRRNERISIRIVTGSEGKLSQGFAAVGRVDSIEPGYILYRVMRRFNLHEFWRSRHFAWLRKQLTNERFSLVYVNSVASGRMLDLLPTADCRVICHVHELAEAIRAVGLHNIDALERRHASYIAVSHAVKDCLVREFSIPSERIEVIYGFVPSLSEGMPGPEYARARLARELNIPADAKVVFSCGSIEPRKGTDLFIDVARRTLKEEGAASIHFVWAGGSADQVSGMRKLVETQGLARHVHFVGHKVNTSSYFAASDVFLLTSREDPFPLVIMEAARLGVPAVCFRDGGGAPEFVAPDAGFCVPDFDVGEMSARVRELISSPALREQLGNAALRKFEAGHTLELGAPKIASYIHQEMRRGCGATRAEGPSLSMSGIALE